MGAGYTKSQARLTAWELGQIVLKFKPEIEEKAKEKLSEYHGNQHESAPLTTLSKVQNSAVDTRKELADTAGIGEVTMGKIIKIDERAPAPVKEALNSGDITVNAGYNITRLLEKLPEEAREAAMERAIALAEKRKNYKSVFDISLDDMNTLLKEDDNAADAIRTALNSGELSVNGGKDVARTLLDMPEDVRESAVDDAEGLAKLEEDYLKKSQAVDDNTDITKAYNAAFECAAGITGSEREVRTWIEWAGIRKDEISGLIEEAENAAEVFSGIAAVLHKIQEQEVMPYEESGDESSAE